MRILIAEDDLRSSEFLAQGLAESGFDVDIAGDGTTAWNRIREASHDLIILDVMMPGMDGWAVLAKLRAAGVETPVLFLTARDTVADRVTGLDLGADDYLVKPFAWPEFLARVRTLLRRRAGAGPEPLRVADLELDPVLMKARRGGRPLDLTTKEFQMLALLVRHQGGTPFPATCWPDRFGRCASWSTRMPSMSHLADCAGKWTDRLPTN